MPRNSVSARYILRLPISRVLFWRGNIIDMRYVHCKLGFASNRPLADWRFVCGPCAENREPLMRTIIILNHGYIGLVFRQNSKFETLTTPSRLTRLILVSKLTNPN
jgi:hypothetical protein